jgi:hypothetical protein
MGLPETATVWEAGRRTGVDTGMTLKVGAYPELALALGPHFASLDIPPP